MRSQRTDVPLMALYIIAMLVPLTTLPGCSRRHESGPTAPPTEPTPTPLFRSGNILTLRYSDGHILEVDSRTGAFTQPLPALQYDMYRQYSGPCSMPSGSMLIPTWTQASNRTVSGPPAVEVVTPVVPGATPSNSLIYRVDDVFAYDAGVVMALDDTLFLHAFAFTPDGHNTLNALLIGSTTRLDYGVVDISDSLSFGGVLSSTTLFTAGTVNRLRSLVAYDLLSGSVRPVTSGGYLVDRNGAGPLAVAPDGTLYMWVFLVVGSPPWHGAIVRIDPLNGRQTLVSEGQHLGRIGGGVCDSDSTIVVLTWGADPFGQTEGSYGLVRVNLRTGTQEPLLLDVESRGIDLVKRDNMHASINLAGVLLSRRVLWSRVARTNSLALFRRR